MIAQPARLKIPSASLFTRQAVLFWGLSLIVFCWVPSHAYARDQESIKADATSQIQAAAALAYYTQPQNVEVRLADKRLVLPDCSDPFEVTFPFSDRATAQLDCSVPAWRGFIQIRLREGSAAFRYNLPLNAGDTLRRNHVIRQSISTEDDRVDRVTVLEDVLDRILKQPVKVVKSC